MQITTLGLDIAKNVFQVHGIDATEKVVVRKQLRRGQVIKFFEALAPCLIGMEACATAHYWARELTKLGHQVRLMPAKDVKAYVKRNKNDAADAEAICEAVNRGAKRVYAGTRGALQIVDDRVTPLTLDVTNMAQIQRAAGQVGSLDLLMNNAGVAIYDDLTNLDAIEQQLAVNLFGVLKVTRAFLPHLRRSKGAIVNSLSLAGISPLPVISGYSISKAALLNMTQSLRALLARQGVTVHGVVLGPIDTDMNRGFDIPKAAPATAARGIFDRVEKGDEEIFPDPASQSIAEGWRTGVAKALESQFAAFVPESAAGGTAAA